MVGSCRKPDLERRFVLSLGGKAEVDEEGFTSLPAAHFALLLSAIIDMDGLL